MIHVKESNDETKRELDAIVSVNAILDELDPDQQRRVINWIADRYLKATPQANQQSRLAGAEEDSDDRLLITNEMIHKRIRETNPRGEMATVLVVADLYQNHIGQNTTFYAHEISDLLKKANRQVSNITQALGQCVSHMPPLVVAEKLGATRQAKNIYRVTESGRKYVADLHEDASSIRAHEHIYETLG